MLNHVSTYACIMTHTRRVIFSCESQLQLETALRWATEILKPFFNRIMWGRGYYEISELDRTYRQARQLLNEAYNLRLSQLQEQQRKTVTQE